MRVDPEIVLSNEDKVVFYALVDRLLSFYQPANLVAVTIVHEIAESTWQRARLQRALKSLWESALAEVPATPGMTEDQRTAQAAIQLTGRGPLARINREITRYTQAISRAERRLHFVHKNFTAGYLGANEEFTADNAIDPTPTMIVETNDTNESEPLVYTSESDPKTMEFLRREFPTRRIAIVGPRRAVTYPANSSAPPNNSPQRQKPAARHIE